MIAKRVRMWVWFVMLLWMVPHTPPEARSAGTDSVAQGQALYHTHCASCHGASARGDGWVGKALRTQPIDLTLLARKNGGIFPDTVVAEFIDGQRDVLAHGQRSMPVWGLNFQNQALIDALVDYLRTLQQQ